jgi:hypothetical protein
MDQDREQGEAGIAMRDHWTLDDWLTEKNHQRVFTAEIRGYPLRASECLQHDHESEDLSARIPADRADPHYIVHLDCGLRLGPHDRDLATVALCEIVIGFAQLDRAADILIDRWERYLGALEGAAAADSGTTR